MFANTETDEKNGTTHRQPTTGFRLNTNRFILKMSPRNSAIQIHNRCLRLELI